MNNSEQPMGAEEIKSTDIIKRTEDADVALAHAKTEAERIDAERKVTTVAMDDTIRHAADNLTKTKIVEDEIKKLKKRFIN